VDRAPSPRRRVPQEGEPLGPPSPGAGRWGGPLGVCRFGALCLSGLLLLPGCAPSTPVRKAALDQDIARDVNWELRKDARFAEVIASCTSGTVTLRGRVDSKAAESNAVQTALSGSRGSRVVSELEIRPR
jgi:hypothetical protein